MKARANQREVIDVDDPVDQTPSQAKGNYHIIPLFDICPI